MSNDIKIIKQLSKDEFAIKVTPNRKPKAVTIQHDYVQFRGINFLQTESGVEVKTDSAVINGFLINSSVQIPIRMFSKFVLPHLNKHEYLKEGSTHLDDRKDKDKTYVPYSHYHGGIALQYYDEENKESMIAFIKKGDRIPTLMTLSFYKEFVEPKLYSYAFKGD